MSFSHRLSRWFALSGLGVDALKARYAGDDDSAKRERLGRVASRMASLRGIPQKMGQILSLRELAEDDSAFVLTTEQGSPVAAAEARAWIEEELKSPLEAVFTSFSEQGIGASIGQVHEATLCDGRRVAVKIQYPDLEQTLDADLAAIGLLASPLTSRAGGFDLAAYRIELRRGILEELDYRREAATLERFAARAESLPWLSVPRPIPEYSTSRLLTMTWIDGEPFRDAQGWSTDLRAELGKELLRFFLLSLFEWGEVHGDPHVGNFRCRRPVGGVQLGVLDFGCLKQLSPIEVNALRAIFLRAGALRPEEALENYSALGFDTTLLEPISAALPAVSAVLALPFHAREPFDCSQWRLSKRIEEILGDDRWNFRFAGPASLLFFVRALSGLLVHLTALDARFSWAEEFERIVAPGPAGQSSSPGTATSARSGTFPTGAVGAGASTLRIAVMEGRTVKVQLTFRSECVERLAELMPPEVLEKLTERRIDVSVLSRKAIVEGLPAGDLFQLSEGTKSFRVWLE